MTNLKSDMATLRLLFEPRKTKPYGPAIWVPQEDDPNGQFKRRTIEMAKEIIFAGDNALAGLSFHVPTFGESEFEEITETLYSDPEERTYYELATACQRVVLSLNRFEA